MVRDDMGRRYSDATGTSSLYHLRYRESEKVGALECLYVSVQVRLRFYSLLGAQARFVAFYKVYKMLTNKTSLPI